MKSLSLTARISLLFAAAASLVLFVTAAILVQKVGAHFEAEDRAELNGKLELIQNLFKRASSRQALDHLPRQLNDALVGHHGLAVVVTNAAGNIWFSTRGADFPRTLSQDCLTKPAACRYGSLHQWKKNAVHYRGMVVSVADGNGRPYVVAVAQDIQHHEIFMNKFRLVLGIAIALAALVLAGLGWIVTCWGLTPLHEVTGTVSGISAERLGARLPASGLPVELRPLATAFNAMLGRLDDSFRRLSECTSNIAHELRTPISNLMTQTQVALSSARSNSEYKEILYSSLEEYERMAQIIGDMLYLAMAENGLLKPGQQPVNLAHETQDLFEYFEAWAAERGVSQTLGGSVTVPGDRLMLRRALSNLIANAIQHTPHGQTVRVELARHGDAAVVTVENPGPEIPPEHLPRLFDRFYRVDLSRQRKGEGAGLGLAIVKSIASAHGGSVAVRSADRSTKFRLTLPALAE
jgi:two-component system heavy metal sensor histidine kinase CusS